MSFKFILFLIALECVEKGTILAQAYKLVYQKDVSEYCRRRVMPSVFLSRRVVEANSQLLQFARLELPYSCFVSIRTESGSSIVFVVQVSSDETLVRSCAQSGNQLLVYEMGETFGGYWGALPENVMRQESPYTKYYTLRTTRKKTTPTTEKTPSSFEYKSDSTITTPIETKISQQQNREEEEYIRMEVPLVNVTGELVPGKKLPDQAFDFNEAFDLLYDVTPRVGERYETSILPLVQFSIQKEWERRGGEQLYRLDYNVESVTPDSRLTHKYFDSITTAVKKRKQFRKNNWFSNRRFHFKKIKSRLFDAQRTTLGFDIFTKQLIPTTLNIQYTRTRQKGFMKHEYPIYKHTLHPIDTDIDSSSVSSDIIEQLMNEINTSVAMNDSMQNEEESKKLSSLIKRISNTKHNFSVYLAPKLSLYDDKTPIIKHPIIVSLEKKVHSDNFTVNYQPVTSYGVEQFNMTPHNYGFSSPSFGSPNDNTIIDELVTNEIDKFSSLNLNNATPRIMHELIVNTSQNVLTDIIKNAKIKVNENLNSKEKSNEHKPDTMKQVISNMTNKPNLSMNSPLTGSMVDHESWENVVQAAPVMAVLLNKSAIQKDIPAPNYTKIKIQDNKNNTTLNKTMRKKRYIQSIQIFNARPHPMSTGREAATTPDYAVHDSDMPNFAQLVELQDDEMHSRVALRYLRHYVGPLLFNVCEYREPKIRHVLLFNSSRIIVAIGNFTIERMTLVATTARALLAAETRCPSAHLECQVSGARVCIDAVSACNGVPNCGANDIYDEDRQQCGASGVVQHSVYLAAFTFLGVLLTGVYVVHYWLKRCIPKVSEAFFIYTDGTENVLYLDSIMKSPADMDDDSKIIYQSNLFQEDVLYENIQEETSRNIFSRLIKKLKFKHKKQAQREESIEGKSYPSGTVPRKMYSFTELELRKMTRKETVDTSIQTGHSLEKAYLNKVYKTEYTTESKCDQSESLRKGTPEFKFLNDTNNFQLKQMNERPSMSDLNILKFTRDTKSISAQQSYIDKLSKLAVDPCEDHIFTSGEEKELNSTMYEATGQCVDHKKDDASVSGTCSHVTSLPGPSGLTRKHLRFDEQAITINPHDFEDDSSVIKHRAVLLGTGKMGFDQDLDTIDEDDEHSGSFGRDFRRFWGGSKGKKGKKKTHISLR